MAFDTEERDILEPIFRKFQLPNEKVYEIKHQLQFRSRKNIFEGFSNEAQRAFAMFREGEIKSTLGTDLSGNSYGSCAAPSQVIDSQVIVSYYENSEPRGNGNMNAVNQIQNTGTSQSLLSPRDNGNMNAANQNTSTSQSLLSPNLIRDELRKQNKRELTFAERCEAWIHENEEHNDNLNSNLELDVNANELEF